MEEDNKRLL